MDARREIKISPPMAAQHVLGAACDSLTAVEQQVLEQQGSAGVRLGKQAAPWSTIRSPPT